MTSVPQKISFWKALKYWLFTFLVLGILFEMIASVVLVRRYATKDPVIVHLVKRFFESKPDVARYHEMHRLVRPDSTAEMNRRVADEIWAANVYSYEPWLQFKVKDFSSTYVNVEGFERRSIPSRFVSSGSADTLDIYFFGGSTMYGYNVTDAESIPSQFLQLYQERFGSRAGAPSIRIRNFGIPYYFSKQELILYSKLIFEGHRPDLVVFMDGLNDFYPSRMLYYDRPHFSYAMQQVFDGRMYNESHRSILDTSDVYYEDVPGMAPEEYYQALLDKYLNNIRMAGKLAQHTGARAYFFCQPVPFFNYPNRDKDPIAYKVSYPRFDYIYPRLRTISSSMHEFEYLGDMLEEETGLPFVDQVHYSPGFSRRIAGRILDKISADLFATSPQP